MSPSSASGSSGASPASAAAGREQSRDHGGVPAPPSHTSSLVNVFGSSTPSRLGSPRAVGWRRWGKYSGGPPTALDPGLRSSSCQCHRKGGPSLLLHHWGGGDDRGARHSPTLTSSSFSRMSFSVSASGTGGMTGMGKSVPLSRVSLLRAERGGEDAVPETPNLTGTQHPPAWTLSPQPHTGPFSRWGGGYEQLQASPPDLSTPNLPHNILWGGPREALPQQGVPGTPEGTEPCPAFSTLSYFGKHPTGCFKLGSGSPHPVFSLLL